MATLRKLFSKKKSPPDEIAEILRIQLLLEGAPTMPERALQLVREVTANRMVKEHGLDETTAKAYYDEILNELRQKIQTKPVSRNDS